MITHKKQTLIYLDLIKQDIEQAAREIYYAMFSYSSGISGKPNLEIALKLLGVDKPENIGLSNSIITDKER